MNMFSRNPEGDNPSESRMTINIVDNKNAYRLRNVDRVLSVQKNGRIVVGVEGSNRLESAEGDYLLFGNVGGSWYVCKRPSGSFKGYKITRQKGKNSSTIFVQAKTLRDIAQGEYRLGEAFSQDGVFWRELIKDE
jgi:hypothetical protein